MATQIGTPVSRVDGHAKVTGAAKYAGEFNVPGLAYGALVTSTIAKGRIAKIDASKALRVEGVIAVLTHENRPHMADKDSDYKDDVAPEGSPFRPLYNANILFSGQPIALVLAEEWETARFAASLVTVDYEEQTPATDLYRQRSDAFTLEGEAFAMSLAKPRGDAGKAFAASNVRHQADYFIPVEHHNPMELYAATVIWEGAGKLTVYDKTQGLQNVQRYLCGVFGLKSEDVRLLSPFVGGAFGSGLRPEFEAPLAVLGALAVKRSVRLVLTRQQMYALCYRPATIESLAIGAKSDGKLEAITHEATAMTSRHEAFARNDTTWSGVLYKSPNAKYAHKLVRLDLPTPCDMRAPGAATGVYGLESAMDELAVALDIDPVELRYRIYSDRDQNEDLPFTSNELRECYRRASEAFGWDKRSPKPRSMRDGKELVGWGMATGVWEALQMEFAARISLTANGHAEVSCATSDIGTG
ncbi:MAG: xanthine dehydrogenase family protein molybdopterin-binding subunit, partial [Rhodomicrobium sp.]